MWPGVIPPQRKLIEKVRKRWSICFQRRSAELIKDLYARAVDTQRDPQKN